MVRQVADRKKRTRPIKSRIYQEAIMEDKLNRVSSNVENAYSQQNNIRQAQSKRRSFFSRVSRKKKEIPTASAGMRDTQLRFKVDPNTNELTVFLVDKGSKKVIRTIPPDEMNKLRDGEFLELFT
jgi:uncharacterized FlaG/YvyC family protein